MTDIPRNRGIHIVAGSGSGKSTVIGKRIACTDFMLGVPLLIIDPQGGTIDNFLDQVLKLPPEAFREVRDSIVYIDMSGKSGYVGQFPIWYRLSQDTPRDVAYRFLYQAPEAESYLGLPTRRGGVTKYDTGRRDWY